MKFSDLKTIIPELNLLYEADIDAELKSICDLDFSLEHGLLFIKNKKTRLIFREEDLSIEKRVSLLDSRENPLYASYMKDEGLYSV